MASVRTLYRLQTIDEALVLASQRLREIQKHLAGNKELRALERSVDSLTARASHYRVQVRDSDLAGRSLSEKIAGVQERLYGGQVTNPRELASLQAEVGHLQRQRERLEDEMLEAMIHLEEQERELTSQQERLEQVRAGWEAARSSLEAERRQLEAQVKHLSAQRSVVQGRLQGEELSTYEELRRRKEGLAVVLLQGQACGGCGVRLPTSIVQQRTRQAESLHFCPSCGRILCAR